MPWTLWVGNRLKRTRFQPLHSRSRRTNSLSWMTILAAAWAGSMKTWKGMDASGASVRKVLTGPVSSDSTRLPTTKTSCDAAAAAGLLDDGGRFVGEVAEDAVGALEIGRVHAGERPLLRLDGRIVGRHLEDRGRDAGLLEDLPEGPALAEVAEPAAGEGDDRLAEADGLGGRGRLGRGEHGHVGFRIAVEEIEDVVAARVHAGDEVGPGHRGLGREARPERPEVAPAGEKPAEGRQPAFVDPSPRQDRVQAVEAEDDHLRSWPGPGRRPWG